MSNENINLEDFFVEEGEIVEHNIMDEEDEEEWGGEQNEIIIPQVEESVAPNPLLPLPLSGRVRRREREEIEPLSSINYRKRIIRDRTPQNSYLILKSGEEFTFTEDDGKNILLNEIIEPNRLIRNIVSRIPIRVKDRLFYLGKFDSEESDEEGQRRYLGNLKELIYEAYIKEWRLRFIFKKFLIRWRINKMNKTCEKEVDPITLSEPEKEVYVYDWDNKRKFIFDAKSLATMIDTKLMYHEYGFPVPMYPKNPKNNVEFSYKQLVSLYYQLKNHGELRWGFTTLREFNFNKYKWYLYHKSALTINSIRSNISRLDTAEGRELLLDFIFAKMEELGFIYSNVTVNNYKTATVQVPYHWYLEKLKSLAISHYEAEHFAQTSISSRSVINTECYKLFKIYKRFINDLKNKKILN